MAKHAGPIHARVFAACESGSMRIASRGADFMAIHTEHFAGSSMTARTQGRISPCRPPMVIGFSRQAQPSRGMGAFAIAELGCRSNLVALMALAT